MSAQEIDYLKTIHKDFVQQATGKIKDFFEGKYNTFDKDESGKPIFQAEFAKRSYAKTRDYYAFLRLMEEIFHLPFVTEVAKIAEKYGFKMEANIIDQYHGEKGFLALELAVNFPLGDKGTYNNQEFRVLTFTRYQPIPGDSSSHITQVQIVPLLKIIVDQENRLQEISPYPFDMLEKWLPPILHEA